MWRWRAINLCLLGVFTSTVIYRVWSLIAWGILVIPSDHFVAYPVSSRVSMSVTSHNKPKVLSTQMVIKSRIRTVTMMRDRDTENVLLSCLIVCSEILKVMRPQAAPTLKGAEHCLTLVHYGLHAWAHFWTPPNRITEMAGIQSQTLG